MWKQVVGMVVGRMYADRTPRENHSIQTFRRIPASFVRENASEAQRKLGRRARLRILRRFGDDSQDAGHLDVRT